MMTTRSTPLPAGDVGDQVGGVAAHRPRQEEREADQQQAGDGETLHERREADAEVVGGSYRHGTRHPDQHPACVDVPTGHFVEVARLEPARREVADDGRQRHRLEGADRHVGEHQRPAADERPGRPEPDEREAQLAPGPRQGRGELGVGQPDQPHHDRAARRRPGSSRRRRPVRSSRRPAPPSSSRPSPRRRWPARRRGRAASGDGGERQPWLKHMTRRRGNSNISGP